MLVDGLAILSWEVRVGLIEKLSFEKKSLRKKGNEPYR